MKPWPFYGEPVATADPGFSDILARMGNIPVRGTGWAENLVLNTGKASPIRSLP
jgi:hypothetical protein